jgi:flagellin-like protein
MRGISAVIAVILILMITVALTATAYVWFMRVFEVITEAGETAAEREARAMATRFTIESARYNPMTDYTNKIMVVIRNTGTVDIDMTTAAAYVGETYQEPENRIALGSLAPGNVGLLNVSNSTIGAVCNSTIRINFDVGPPSTAVISCT